MSNSYVYNPRPYLPAAASPCTPNDRFSTASAAPLSSIGNMLASAYDTDDSDAEDIIRTPSDGPSGNARANRGDRRLTQSRQVPPKYMRSIAGEVEVISFQAEDQNPQARSPQSKGRIDANGHKRVTIIDFPSPSLYPSSPQSYPFPTQPRTPEPPARIYNPMTTPVRKPVATPVYPSPSRPGLISSPVGPNAFHPPSPARNYPSSPTTHGRPQLQLLTQTASHHGLTAPRQIPILPPPASPISPLLARPPASHSSPIPRFFGAAAGDRASTASGISTNESVAGFDTMKEKNALFRGGEEELMAFSPRIKRMVTGAGAGHRNTWMGKRRTVMGAAGADFWKRFSVMGAEGLSAGKESEWLSSHNSGWKSIKRWIVIGLILLLLAIGGGVTAGILLSQRKA